MNERSIIHNTFVIEQNYPVTPERVFEAFADPAKKRRWFAEGHDHEVDQFEMNFRVGGHERARYRLKGGPLKGTMLTMEGPYQDIVTNRRVVQAATMVLGDQRISAALATVEFVETDQGTDVILKHQGAFFEGADGPEMRQAGWRQLLDQLARELTR